jgi:hypothetical protein
LKKYADLKVIFGEVVGFAIRKKTGISAKEGAGRDLPPSRKKAKMKMYE